MSLSVVSGPHLLNGFFVSICGRILDGGDLFHIKRQGGMLLEKLKWLFHRFMIVTSILVIFSGFLSCGSSGDDDDDNDTSQSGFWLLYGGTDEDHGTYVQQTSDGGYIVCGGTCVDGPDWHEDVYLLKVDSRGNEQWSRSFGGYYLDFGTAVVQTSDGGYAVTGKFYSTDELTIVKTDQDGNELWTHNYFPNAHSHANAMQQTSDGGLIVTGQYMEGMDFYPSFILKTDAHGIEEWSAFHSVKDINGGLSVIQLSDGGYAYCGTSHDESVTRQDIIVTRTDSSGSPLWTVSHSPFQDNEPHCIRSTADNGFIVFATVWDSGPAYTNMYLLKLDSAGNIEWTQHYDDSRGGCYSGIQTPDGGYVLCGVTSTYSDDYSDVYLVKTDSSGNKKWGVSIGRYGFNNGRCIQLTQEGGFIIAGRSTQHSAGDPQLLLIKTDNEGQLD